MNRLLITAMGECVPNALLVLGGDQPLTVEKITDDQGALRAYYYTPPEHWVYVRAENPIDLRYTNASKLVLDSEA